MAKQKNKTKKSKVIRKRESGRIEEWMAVWIGQGMIEE